MATASRLTAADFIPGAGADVLTPALVLRPAGVAHNVDRVIELLDGDPERWRPHAKTAKLAWTARLLVGRGVTSFKCATTRELEMLCEAGALDVCVAYPLSPAARAQAAEVAARHPRVAVSSLADDEAQLAGWDPVLGLMLDVDVGMERGGIPLEQTEALRSLARAARAAGLDVRGLHGYDGHLGALSPDERSASIERSAQGLAALANQLNADGIALGEILTSGTPTFLEAAAQPALRDGPWRHRVGAGTVVYTDLMTLEALPGAGFAPAVAVVGRVVSVATAGRPICDAGSKAVAVDQGSPTCAVLGYPGLVPQRPSEEHLPLLVAEGPAPALGELLALVPRHVCTTVHAFDRALLVEDGRVAGVEDVTARGRDGPLRA